jgi:hypothetical protein
MSFFDQLSKRMRNYIIKQRPAGVAPLKEVNYGIRTRQQARMLRW